MFKFLFSFLLPFAMWAQIHVTNDLSSIERELQNAGPETLVLFDVDATLIVPDDAILRPQNEPFLHELLGGDKIQNLPTGVRYVFREILLSAPHSLVDERSPALLRTLQERGILVAAFTGAPRGKIGKIDSVADWRIEELKRYGFDFNWDLGVIELPKSPGKQFSPLFKSGSLFSSLHDKGETLENFLKAIGWTPKRIVLIDDQMEHVKSVGKVAEKLGVEYLGFHYTAAAELPCELDSERARFQVRHFIDQGEWISDRVYSASS